MWATGMCGALGLMSVIAPNVDLFGHVGGLVGGYLMSMAMADMKESHRPDWYEAGTGWCKFILTWICLGGGFKVLFLNPAVPLPDCGTLLHPRSLMY